MWRLMRAPCVLQFLVLVVGFQSARAEELTGILMVEISGLKDASGNIYCSL
jgi:uncharacterized protein (DUF2141 family)